MCNNLLNLAFKYSKKRILITNTNNGKAYMCCVIVGKNNQYVLQSWDKLL